MTTTTVTVHESTYDIGLRHVYFDGWASTSTVGEFWSDGWLEWHVFYPGSTTADESYQGTHAFSYVCDLPGTYTFKYRAIDRGGNAGAWVETEVVVANISTADYVQYVDTAAGNNANAGTTSGSPVQTLAQAMTNLKANWTSGGTHVAYIKYGQNPQGNPLGEGGHTVVGRILFAPWGNPGDGAAVARNTFAAVVCGSGQVSYAFRDLTIEFGDHGGFDLDGGITRTVPYDFILKNCTVTQTVSGFPRNIVVGQGNERSGTDRDNNVFSFVALDNVTIQAPDALFGIYGFSYGSLLHFVDVHIDGLKTDSTSHCIRVWNVRNLYARGCLWEANAPTGNDIRLATYAGAGLADATEKITFHNCTVTGGSVYSHEAEDDLYYVRDVQVIGCQGMFSATKGLGGFGGSWDADRIVNRNSYGHGSEYSFDLHATNGNCGSFLFEHCLRLRDEAGYSIFTFNRALARYTGTIKLRNCVFHWEESGNPAAQILYQSVSLSDSDLDAILDSDRVAAVTVDADAITWASTTSGSSSLAAWQSSSGQDANSYATLSTSLPLTTFPSGDPDWDPHLTGTGGYLADKGSDDTYTFDLDGKLRIGDYLGPDDPEATDSPTVPTLGSGSDPAPSVSGSRTRLSLKLGL